MKRAKNPMRRSEWALLAIPCAGLLGIGWWHLRAKNSPSASDDPTAPTVLSAKTEPITPLDAYNGWDTRFVLEAQVPAHLRPAPGDFSVSAQADLTNETLHFRRGNQNVVLPITNGKMFQSILSNGETTKTILLMKLRNLPVTDSAVTLRGEVVAHYWRVAMVKGKSGNIRTRSQPIALKLQIRRENEQVKLPVVSHYRPFVLDKVSVEHQDISSGATIQADTTVKMVFSGTDAANPNFTPFLDNLRLVDARGREYQSFFSPNTKAPVSPMWSQQSVKDSPDGKYHQWISFPVGFLSPSAGRITFKTDVSVDNCWPIPVSVVVRDK